MTISNTTPVYSAPDENLVPVSDYLDLHWEKNAYNLKQSAAALASPRVRNTTGLHPVRVQMVLWI